MLQTVTIALFVLVVSRVLYERWRDRSLPPGPRRLPFIGNLHLAPLGHQWLTYQEWSKRYGPIFSLQYGRDTLVVITDQEVARTLLDKRGSTYSDRPRMVMAGENLTKGMNLLLRRYDDRYRLHQRLEAPVLSPRASSAYHPLQDLESKQLLYDFLTRNDFRKLFGRYSASLVYTLAYGFRVSTGNEQCLMDAHRVQENFIYSAQVGLWVVDTLPFLNHLPTIFAPWKRTAEEFFRLEAAMHTKNMEAGLNSKAWNWTKDFAKAKETQAMPTLELAYDMGILADAGLDTTTMVLEVFMVACLCHPSFIRPAQAQLDEVVGSHRLPQFEDRDRLPYIDAIVREALRWRPITPAGFPHRVTEADRYMQYRIPMGAIVVPLIWAMNLSDTVFDGPHEFRPERWLFESAEQRSPSFGFGRRMCTGRHIAQNSLYLIIARLLWAFDIRHAVDAGGAKQEVDPMAFTPGFASRPLPFQAVLEPRSEEARAVVEREWGSTEKDVDVILDQIREHQIRLGLKPRA